MKKLIIRKPKFMRSDVAMMTYIRVAKSISKVYKKSGPEMPGDERYELLRQLGYCVNKAVKAGGFFSVRDFLEWAERHNISVA